MQAGSSRAGQTCSAASSDRAHHERVKQVPVRPLCDLCFVEVFAGCARLSKAFQSEGVQCTSVDSKPTEGAKVLVLNLLRAPSAQLLLRLIECRKLLMVHMAPPCSTGSRFLRKQGEWRQLTQAWPNPQMQHDAAEFLQHLVQQDVLVQDLSVWRTCAVGVEGAPRMDAGRGVILIPVRNDVHEPYTLLQDCVQAWHEQLQLHVIRSGTEFVGFAAESLPTTGPIYKEGHCFYCLG